MGKGLWIIGGVAALMFLFVFSLILAVAVSDSTMGGNVAHIRMRGVIVSETEQSLFGSSGASAADIAANIKKANDNPNIKAILLDINSPGGGAVASEEIVRALEKTDKPVVALIRDVGASGAYWAASASDEIVASPLSMTGSVGATASYIEFSGLFDEWGIGYERIVSGQYKDAGTPFRNLTDEEEALFQEMISLTGEYFANSVQENRGLSNETMEVVSTGRIFIGEQAYNLGLVDHLGSMDEAKEVLKAQTGLEEITLVPYEPPKPFSFGSFLMQSGEAFGLGLMGTIVQQPQVSLR